MERPTKTTRHPLPLLALAAAVALSGCSRATPDGNGMTGGGAGGSGGHSGGGAGTSGGGAGGASGGGGAVTLTGNPFRDATFYVNPDYVAEVQSSIDATPAQAALLGKLRTMPTAIWLDRIATVADIGRHLDAALAQQQASGTPVITLFVIYDLPGRDCHANASNGELSLAASDVARYRHDYIDVIAAAFAAHGRQRIAAIVEPDSLPNLATNLSDPRCAAAETAYRDNVAYAVSQLAQPHVALYLDAAHSGWLGWTDNSAKAAAIFRDVLMAAGGFDKVRGFATNTANYSPLHEGHERFDYQGNPCHDELTFVSQLAAALAAVGVQDKAFVVDTSRNGRTGIRAQWGSWCNVNGAGLGERPVADPVAGIDAYLWVKPPGESDGVADSTQPRFDAMCGSGNADATPGAPQAGQWFSSYLSTLVAEALPAL